MKKYTFLVFVIILLLVLYGILYLKTIRLEKVKDNLGNELSNLQSENEELNVKLLNKISPAAIDYLAREKYKMEMPKSFYVVEIQENGK